MRSILIAALAAGCVTAASADLVASTGGNELRLMASPCVHDGVLGMLKPEWRAAFKKAQATVGGKTFAACWIDTGEGAYFVQFEDGTGMGYPISGFVDQPGT